MPAPLSPPPPPARARGSLLRSQVLDAQEATLRGPRIRRAWHPFWSCWMRASSLDGAALLGRRPLTLCLSSPQVPLPGPRPPGLDLPCHHPRQRCLYVRRLALPQQRRGEAHRSGNRHRARAQMRGEPLAPVARHSPPTHGLPLARRRPLHSRRRHRRNLPTKPTDISQTREIRVF